MEGDRYAATPRSRRGPDAAADAAALAERPPDASERSLVLTPDGGGSARLALGGDACVRVRIGRGAPHEDADAAGWRPAPLRRLEREDGVLVVGAPGQRTRLEIARAPLRVRLVGRDGAPLTVLGDLACETDGVARAALALPPDAHLHGGGDAPGSFERRGARLLAGRGAPGRFPVPFLLVQRPGPAPAAWGVLVCGPPSGRVELDAGAARSDALGVAAEGDDLDLWILAGPRPADVLARLAERLGPCPLPPRWALGHHLVTRAASARAVERLAGRARRRGVALGAVHHVATARPWRLVRRGTEPVDLAPRVAAQGLRSVVHVAPDVRVDPDDPEYRDGLARGVFVRDADGRIRTRRGAARPDLARADARRWWSERHHLRVAAGASGFWNEAAAPLEEHAKGSAPTAGEPGFHGTRHAEAARRALLAARPGERPFVLAEAGGPGVTREAALAVADGPGGWEGLRARIPRLLSLSLSGAAFCGVDLHDAASPELFARAIQIAALQPLLRSRGAAAERALLRGRAGPRADAIAREALALRERLRPYLYGLLRAAEETGAPVWRPLSYAFPEDAESAGIDDQLLVGPALLAAPVCVPGARERDVHLPPGDWFAWHDGALFRGPRRLRVAVPLERLPLFVRAGSLLPTTPPASPDADGPAVPTLEVFPGHDGALEWTEDDGETLAYRDGAVARTAVRLWSRPGGRLRVELGRREGSWSPATRAVHLRVHACPPPRRVLLDGAPLPADAADDASDGRDAPRYRVGNGELEVRLPDVDRGAAVEVEPAS